MTDADNEIERLWALAPAHLRVLVEHQIAAARREGAEEMREKIAGWHDDAAEAADPGTGGLARHQYYASRVRAITLRGDTP